MKYVFVLAFCFLTSSLCFAEDIILSLNNTDEAIFHNGSIKSLGNILIIQNGNEIRAVSVGKTKRKTQEGVHNATYPERGLDGEIHLPTDDEIPLPKRLPTGIELENRGLAEQALETFQRDAETTEEKGNYGSAAFSYMLACMPEEAKRLYLLAAEEAEKYKEWMEAAFYYQKLGMADKYKEMIRKNLKEGGQP